MPEFTLVPFFYGSPLCLFQLFTVHNNQVVGTLCILRLPTYPVLEFKVNLSGKMYLGSNGDKDSITFDMDMSDFLTITNILK